jgi:hypothetical protein
MLQFRALIAKSERLDFGAMPKDFLLLLLIAALFVLLGVFTLHIL